MTASNNRYVLRQKAWSGALAIPLSKLKNPRKNFGLLSHVEDEHIESQRRGKTGSSSNSKWQSLDRTLSYQTQLL